MKFCVRRAGVWREQANNSAYFKKRTSVVGFLKIDEIATALSTDALI